MAPRALDTAAAQVVRIRSHRHGAGEGVRTLCVDRADTSRRFGNGPVVMALSAAQERGWNARDCLPVIAIDQ